VGATVVARTTSTSPLIASVVITAPVHQPPDHYRGVAKGPVELMLVRPGESTGNVARRVTALCPVRRRSILLVIRAPNSAASAA